MAGVNPSKLDQAIREAEELVLVQFWAPWSASCATMTTMLEGLMGDPSVPFRLIRVKMDGTIASPNPYGVLTVPTLLIFLQGKLRHQIIGLTTEERLRQKLERAWHEPRQTNTSRPSS
jgi:thioredoxin 1